MRSKVEETNAAERRSSKIEAEAAPAKRRRPAKRRQPAQPGTEVADDNSAPHGLVASTALSVSIIGAGRLGTALARALAACGYDVAAVVARRQSQARRAAAATATPQTRALKATQLAQLPRTDILIITTPDDLIGGVAARLAASLNSPPTAKAGGAKSNAAKRARGSTRRVVLHASGALSSADALAPLAECGFAVGSMHPLVSVSDALSGAESLRGAFYCLEGERAAVSVARRIVRDLGGRSFSVRTADKSLYHAAAVLASGHAVALFDVAAELLARCGLAPAAARRILMPLVRSTLDNLSTQPPQRALTGTFARADAATVRKHLAALRRAATREAHDVYVLLGKHSLRLAVRNGADASAVRAIARALEDAEVTVPTTKDGRR